MSSLLFSIFSFLLGTIIGSFLNVVILRLPHGKSLSDPRRSCCPKCQRLLPWWENIPILSWLLLRGRCAGCREKISLQYPLVELSTGFLFYFCYYFFPWPVAAAYAGFLSLLLIATVIDLQHWIIPDQITIGGTIAGVAASALIPELMETSSRGRAALISIGTAAAGYGLLWGILELGKFLFGKKRTLFAEPLPLRLSSPEKPRLHLDEEEIELEELLLRPSDRVIAYANWIEVAGQRFTNQHFYLNHQGLRIDGVLAELAADDAEQGVDGAQQRSVYKNTRAASTDVTQLCSSAVELSEKSGHAWPLDHVIPFQAEITEVILPREAMGFGDVKFLSCIGAFLGWKGMLAALFGGSILGSVVALFLLLITRGRVGRSIPFGPALAAAAALWLFRSAIGVGPAYWHI